MTKTELIKATAKRAGVTQEMAAAVITAALEATAEALASGEPVKVNGFGTLAPRERKARVARNLKTGEQVAVEARQVVAFSASKELKRMINEVD